MAQPTLSPAPRGGGCYTSQGWRGVERPLTPFCLTGWFKGRGFRSWEREWAGLPGGSRLLQGAGPDAQVPAGRWGGGQGRVEAAEPVGPWLKTGPTPKCLRIRPASPSQEGALLGWHMLLGFLPRVPRALGRGWQGAEGLIRGSQEGNPQGRHSKKG